MRRPPSRAKRKAPRQFVCRGAIRNSTASAVTPDPCPLRFKSDRPTESLSTIQFGCKWTERGAPGRSALHGVLQFVQVASPEPAHCCALSECHAGQIMDILFLGTLCPMIWLKAGKVESFCEDIFCTGRQIFARERKDPATLTHGGCSKATLQFLPVRKPVGPSSRQADENRASPNSGGHIGLSTQRAAGTY
jgi:hypothetical protein